jgi:hypothetical protein
VAVTVALSVVAAIAAFPIAAAGCPPDAYECPV